MRLINADALLNKISKDVHRMYDQLTDEIIEHFDLEDSKAIYMHSAEQYIKVKFAYQWIKNELEKAKEVDVQLEVSEKIEKQIRDEVIDEFIKLCDKHCHFYEDKHPRNGYVLNRATLLEIAEQLKD